MTGMPVEYGVVQVIDPLATEPLVRRIVAPNPGPFTLTGTNTFILGQGRVAVIDPGPASPDHVEALLAGLRGETVEAILVTHTHLDHSPAAALLRARTGAPTHGFGPHGAGRPVADCDAGLDDAGADRDFVPDVTVADGAVIEGEGWSVRAVHTPGHAANHLCFALAGRGWLFSGDHVMGWSSTVVSPPDGDMAAYMASLDRLLGRLVDRADTRYLPAHGPAIDDPQARVRALIDHRRARRQAILDGLARGDRTIEALVAAIYTGLAPALRPAAGRNVLSHLLELRAAGLVSPGLGTTWRLS
ncbi:MAG TPA: MBL fold metallo-hydrolase [Stellaceae bacterium]|nr:MBL fold metallo-hydrolase [Stellaceae bacterium]